MSTFLDNFLKERRPWKKNRLLLDQERNLVFIADFVIRVQGPLVRSSTTEDEGRIDAVQAVIDDNDLGVSICSIQFSEFSPKPEMQESLRKLLRNPWEIFEKDREDKRCEACYSSEVR